MSRHVCSYWESGRLRSHLCILSWQLLAGSAVWGWCCSITEVCTWCKSLGGPSSLQKQLAARLSQVENHIDGSAVASAKERLKFGVTRITFGLLEVSSAKDKLINSEMISAWRSWWWIQLTVGWWARICHPAGSATGAKDGQQLLGYISCCHHHSLAAWDRAAVCLAQLLAIPQGVLVALGTSQGRVLLTSSSIMSSLVWKRGGMLPLSLPLFIMRLGSKVK